MKKLLILLKKVIRKIYSLTKSSISILEPLASKTGFTAALYYLFFSQSFRNEQKAVLSGKVAYRRSLREVVESSYLLRRNIHRIEKGLIMEPQKPVFARTYIRETIQVLNAITSKASSVTPELKWAFGVLDEYFKVVSDKDSNIKSMKKKYNEIRANIEIDIGPKPYKAEKLESNPIKPEQFLELCNIRRSVRWYEDKQVPRDIIEKAIEAAGTAPSACNRQPFKYLIFDEPKLLKEVSAIPMGSENFSDNFQALAVIIGDLGAYYDERDRHIIYIDGALSAMTFMFSLKTYGVSSCSINWPDIGYKEKKIRKVLSLPQSKRIIMLISLGYARKDGLVPSSLKKPTEQLREYNYTK